MTNVLGQQAGAVALRAAVDCHGHAVSDAYLRALRRYDAQDPGILRARRAFSDPTPARRALIGRLADQDSLARRLAAMDAAGVQLQVLSVAAPYPWCSDPGWAAEFTRAWNDGAGAIAEAHPGRFAMFAMVPLPYVEAAIVETARVMANRSMVGVSMTTHIQGVPIDDERWYPLYQQWDSLGLTVFLHPDGFCAKGVLDDHDMTFDLGPVFDDTIAAVRLYTSGILRDFPRIRWIVPHLGGTLPFLLGRLDRHWERDRSVKSLDHPPSEAAGELCFDTAGCDASAVRLGAEVLGTGRLLFGSDYPMVTGDDLAFGRGAMAGSGLEPADLERVLWSNAVTGVLPRLNQVLPGEVFRG